MQYTDAIFVFSNDDDTSLFPEPRDLFSLLQDGITSQYLRNVVRALSGFEEVNEATIRAI
jgi:hypothetical protein